MKDYLKRRHNLQKKTEIVKMIGIAMYNTIKTLWKKGKNKTQIANDLHLNWRTVAKYINIIEQGKSYPSKKMHPKILDNYQEIIIKWIEEKLTAVRIYEKLTSMGIKISYSAVKNFINPMKKKKNIFVRIHTKPGEEAQVDFGYVGYTIDNEGKRRKTWVFNMRLSHSRMDYFEKVYNQKVETFINCHINAFNYFGGIPKTVKIDNLKAAILDANFYQPIYQQLYLNFANFYGFDPLACRVYRPNDKGKTEAGIKYVKNNFFLGRTFKNEDDLDQKLRNWLNNKCNKRIHGTTKKIPFQVFETEEKAKLLPLPENEFKLDQVGLRKVYHDCHVYIKHNYYSVPFEYVGKEVEIAINDKIVKIYYNNIEIAIHPLLKGRGRFSTQNSHYPKYKMMSETEFQEKYQIKMAHIGSFAEQVFFLLLEKKPMYWGRMVKGILSLEKTYSKEIINLSCKRALAYNVCEYQIIKNICKQGVYNLPLEFEKEAYAYYKK